MAEKLQWEFELINKFTATSDAITGRLEAIEKQLTAVDKAAEKTAKGIGFLSIKSALGSAFDVGKAAVGAAAGIGGEILKAAGDAEKLRKSFEEILGKKGASEFSKTVETISANSELTSEQVSAAARPLLLAGLRGQELTNALTVGLDRAAKLGTGAAGAEAATDLISKVALTGKVNDRVLFGLGIKGSEFYEQLGARLKVSAKEAEKLAGSGQIKGIVNQITDTFAAAQGKQLGRGAAGARDNFNTIVAKLKEAPLDLFKGLNETKGFAALTKSLAEVFDFIRPDGPFGKKATAVISESFNALFGGSAGKKTVDVVKEALNGVLKAIEKLPSVIEDLRDAFDGAVAVARFLGDVLFVVEGIFVALGEAIGTIAGFIVVSLTDAFSAVTSFGGSIGDFLAQGVNAIIEFGSTIYTAGMELGSKLWQGLKDGLTAGIDAIKGTVSSVADAVKGTFKEALGLHSPSAVFAEFGNMSVAGFNQGMTGGNFSPSADALVSAVEPRKGGISSNISGAVELHIHVEGGGHDAESLANRLTAMLPGALEGAMSKLATEMGA